MWPGTPVIGGPGGRDSAFGLGGAAGEDAGDTEPEEAEESTAVDT